MSINATFLLPREHRGSDPTRGRRRKRGPPLWSADPSWRAIIIASMRDARSDPFAVDETSMWSNSEWRPVALPSDRPATQRRWTMPVIRLAQSVLDPMRRRGALGLFRLASLILRRATDLFQRRRIARADLGAALAAAKLLERCGGVLLLGMSRPQDQSDRGKTDWS
jgi:hypothetical protein